MKPDNASECVNDAVDLRPSPVLILDLDVVAVDVGDPHGIQLIKPARSKLDSTAVRVTNIRRCGGTIRGCEIAVDERAILRVSLKEDTVTDRRHQRMACPVSADQDGR